MQVESTMTTKQYIDQALHASTTIWRRARHTINPPCHHHDTTVRVWGDTSSYCLLHCTFHHNLPSFAALHVAVLVSLLTMPLSYYPPHITPHHQWCSHTHTHTHTHTHKHTLLTSTKQHTSSWSTSPVLTTSPPSPLVSTWCTRWLWTVAGGIFRDHCDTRCRARGKASHKVITHPLDWLFHHTLCWLIDWLVGWLIDWLVEWLIASHIIVMDTLLWLTAVPIPHTLLIIYPTDWPNPYNIMWYNPIWCDAMICYDMLMSIGDAGGGAFHVLRWLIRSHGHGQVIAKQHSYIHPTPWSSRYRHPLLMNDTCLISWSWTGNIATDDHREAPFIDWLIE